MVVGSPSLTPLGSGAVGRPGDCLDLRRTEPEAERPRRVRQSIGLDAAPDACAAASIASAVPQGSPARAVPGR